MDNFKSSAAPSSISFVHNQLNIPVSENTEPSKWSSKSRLVDKAGPADGHASPVVVNRVNSSENRKSASNGCWKKLSLCFRCIKTKQRDPLHTAIKNGNLEKIQTLIAQGVDLCKQDKNGQTALHWAAKYGRGEVFKLLWHHYSSGDIKDMRNIKDINGQSPAELLMNSMGTEAVNNLLCEYLTERPEINEELVQRLSSSLLIVPTTSLVVLFAFLNALETAHNAGCKT